MEILYAPKFVRQYKKLPVDIQRLTQKREALFCLNPYNPILKTHKLSGRLGKYYAFSVNFSYRIIFDFVDTNTVHFYEIGTHDIYD